MTGISARTCKPAPDGAHDRGRTGEPLPYQGSALPTELRGLSRVQPNKRIGEGTYREGTRNPRPALWHTASGIFPAIPSSTYVVPTTMTCFYGRHYLLHANYGGEGRIRTSEGYAGRFTVCSLWPLGNLSLEKPAIRATKSRQAFLCSTINNKLQLIFHNCRAEITTRTKNTIL